MPPVRGRKGVALPERAPVKCLLGLDAALERVVASVDATDRCVERAQGSRLTPVATSSTMRHRVSDRAESPRSAASATRAKARRRGGFGCTVFIAVLHFLARGQGASAAKGCPRHPWRSVRDPSWTRGGWIRSSAIRGGPWRSNHSAVRQGAGGGTSKRGRPSASTRPSAGGGTASARASYRLARTIGNGKTMQILIDTLVRSRRRRLVIRPAAPRQRAREARWDDRSATR